MTYVEPRSVGPTTDGQLIAETPRGTEQIRCQPEPFPVSLEWIGLLLSSDGR